MHLLNAEGVFDLIEEPTRRGRLGADFAAKRAGQLSNQVPLFITQGIRDIHVDRHDLVTAIKSNIGVSVRVEVIEPDGVERSMGKMRRIVDLRGGA